MAAGCGGGGGSKADVGGSLPDCAPAGETVQLPAALEAFPLPSGASFGGVRTDVAGNKVYRASIAGGLRDVRDYYETELPKSGYTIGEGDAEEHEAEADFTGHGGSGHFKLNDLPDCDGAVQLEVALR